MNEHIDLDMLADYAEGLVDDEHSERIAGHVATCAHCTDQLTALGDVSALLATAEPPAMPAAVATRIDAALAAEARRAGGTGGTGAADVSDSNVVGLRSRRQRWLAPLTAAAAAVVVLGGGAALIQRTLDPGTGNNSTASQSAPQEDTSARAEPNRADGPPVVDSGTHYTRAALPAQVNAIVADAGHPGATEGGTAASTTTESAGCVQRIAQKAGQPEPIVVDRADYEGAPAHVLVFKASGSSDRLGVWIVDSSCSADHDGVVAHTTVHRSG